MLSGPNDHLEVVCVRPLFGVFHAALCPNNLFTWRKDYFMHDDVVRGIYVTGLNDYVAVLIDKSQSVKLQARSFVMHYYLRYNTTSR